MISRLSIHKTELNTGTHDELIKYPNGAYTQLVRMQEGTKETEDSKEEETERKDMSLDLEKSMSRSTSQQRSVRKSTSIGSGRKSFALNLNAPGFIDIREEEEESAPTDENALEKRKKVSIKRLAYLNKPELPILLLGSVAAAAHGVIFPIFGLLISTAIKIFYEPPHELRKDSRFWALMYVALGLCTLVAVPLQNYLFGIAGGKLIERIRSLSFEKVVHQEISWFDDPANSRCVNKENIVPILFT